MTSQPWKQIIAKHVLPNIPRSKGNHTMKFGQLKYSMRNILLKKSFENCGGKTIPRPFSNKSKIEHITGSINSLKFYTVCFYCMPSSALSKYSETSE